MYKVYGVKKSRTFRVLWMLEELGLDYEHIPALPRSDEVRALNVSGKIPVLVTPEGEALTDSAAIIQFLADRHGDFTFPAGTADRARQDALTFATLDEIDAVLWTAARHSFVLPEEHRLPEIKESLKWEFARNLEAMEARLGDGPFLMGERMTVPDILLGHCGGWAANAKFPTYEGKLADYLDRLQSRPAFRKAAGL